jgi:hypothetical protein
MACGSLAVMAKPNRAERRRLQRAQQQGDNHPPLASNDDATTVPNADVPLSPSAVSTRNTSRLLDRSTIEAYVGIAITIGTASYSMTWWIKAILLIVVCGLAVDFCFRSPWTAGRTNAIRATCSAVAVGLIVVFSWGMIQRQYAEDNKLSLKDAAGFASAIVIALADREFDIKDFYNRIPGKESVHYLGGGVFITRDGYAITCAKSAIYDQQEIHLPFIPEAQKVYVVGSRAVPGKRIATDWFGLAIIKVPINGQLPYIPELALSTPNIGDKVFLYGLETGVFPSFTTEEGTVDRVGSGSNGMPAIFANIPFRSAYCGAPVIGEQRTLIGIAIGPSNGGSEILPAYKIKAFMEQNKL